MAKLAVELVHRGTLLTDQRLADFEMSGDGGGAGIHPPRCQHYGDAGLGQLLYCMGHVVLRHGVKRHAGRE